MSRASTANGDFEVTFHLKRPQPSFPALLASGFSPIYPCHVRGADAHHAVGTGPFKFVEYKPNQSIKLTQEPRLLEAGPPYLDGIEYTIIPNRSTAILTFVSGKFDITFPYEVTIPLAGRHQEPDAERDVRHRPDERHAPT